MSGLPMEAPWTAFWTAGESVGRSALRRVSTPNESGRSSPFMLLVPQSLIRGGLSVLLRLPGSPLFRLSVTLGLALCLEIGPHEVEDLRGQRLQHLRLLH